MSKTKVKDKHQEWESIWAEYVNALAVLDKPIKGANARLARARLAKAERKIERADPLFYKRIILKVLS